MGAAFFSSVSGINSSFLIQLMLIAAMLTDPVRHCCFETNSCLSLVVTLKPRL